MATWNLREKWPLGMWINGTPKGWFLTNEHQNMEIKMDGFGWFWQLCMKDDEIYVERWLGRECELTRRSLGRRSPESVFFCLKSPSNRLYHHIP